MKDMLDASVEYLKKITPCTTVPTSPGSDLGLGDFKYFTKVRLVQEFEEKITTLLRIVVNKTLDVNERMAAVQTSDAKNKEKRKTISKEKVKKNKDQKSFSSMKWAQDADLINEDMQRTVMLLENRNKAEVKELDDLQERVNEGKLVQQLTERRINDINRSLLGLYADKQEKHEVYVKVVAEKKKTMQMAEVVKNTLATLKADKSAVQRKQTEIEKRKKLLAEKLAKIESQKIRVFQLQFCIGSEQTQIQDALATVKELDRKKKDLVENIKAKINCIEELGEKAQVQTKLFRLRQRKVQQDSRKIFAASSEIFELLKLVESKSTELDAEITESNKRQQAFHSQLFEYKENQEIQEKLRVLKLNRRSAAV